METAEISFAQFTKMMLAAGYNQVIERIWEPDLTLEEHTHPYDVNAMVVQGEFVLTVKGEEPRKIVAGESFHVLANTPHSEQYGAVGATFWAARKGRIPS
jgi:quercetin dioxygenase-like cupin family protein